MTKGFGSDPGAVRDDENRPCSGGVGNTHKNLFAGRDSTMLLCNIHLVVTICLFSQASFMRRKASSVSLFCFSKSHTDPTRFLILLKVVPCPTL